MITKSVKVTVNEIADGGLETPVLTLSTTVAHPESYVLEFMGTVTLISRKNLMEAVKTINDLSTLTET